MTRQHRPDRFHAFDDSFSNWGLDEDDRELLQALADYTTNTLRVYAPADDPVMMTIIHAFVSREEFMHGEWSAAIVHTCARLRLAAIDSFYEVLQSSDPDTEAALTEIYEAWTVAQQIDKAIEPFQEAVDKIQILSVVEGDSEYLQRVEETHEAVYGTNTENGALSEQLEKQIEDQIDISVGRKHVDRGPASNLYVNPLYTFALRSLGPFDVDTTTVGNESASDIAGFSQIRAIAETVARVALDIPFPIEPLGTSRLNEALDTDNLDVESISLADLEELRGPASDYRVDHSEIERYLLEHASEVADPRVREKLWTDDGTYKTNWLDHVFVTTLKELARLQEQDSVPSDTDELRRVLSEAVHGVDVTRDGVTTMADRPTHLLAIPARDSDGVADQDYLDVEREPLPKILLEAFEQHGSFGAAVFRPTNGENSRQMNFHTAESEAFKKFDNIPDHIDTYRSLWEHYFIGKELLNTLFAQNSAYRGHLIGAFADAYETPAACLSAIERCVEATTRPDDMSSPKAREATGLGSKGPADEQRSALIDSEMELDHAVGGSDGMNTSQRTELRSVLSDWPTWYLREAAQTLDIPFDDPDSWDRLPAFTCPLCALDQAPCGDSECAVEPLRQSFNESVPVLLDELFAIEAEW